MLSEVEGRCLERGLNDGVKVHDQVCQATNKEVDISHLICLLRIHDVRVQSIEVQNVAYHVLKECGEHSNEVRELCPPHDNVLIVVE